MWPIFKLLFSRNYWHLVLRGQTWRDTWIALRRAHKDRRAWRQFARTFYLFLVPFSIPVFLLGIGLLFIGGAGVILIWVFIGVMIALGRIGFGKPKPQKQPDTIAGLNLSKLARAEPAAPAEHKTPELRREIAELCLLHAVIADRAGSERFLQTKVLPEGLTVITRRRHIDMLREHQIYDRLGPIERDLLLLPDGHWPAEILDDAFLTLEPLRLFRWVLGIDDYLPTNGETLRADFRLSSTLTADPELPFRGEEWVSTGAMETAIHTANQFFYRCWAEGVYRGFYQAPTEDRAEELRNYAIRFNGQEGEDMLFGATIVSRAADHQVRLAAMLSIRRARILGWVLERLRNQRPPEPAITLFYPPTIQREAEESTA